MSCLIELLALVELESGHRHLPLDGSTRSLLWLLNFLGLLDEVDWDDTLADHFSLHENVFVVAVVVILDLVLDGIKISVGGVTTVSSLELGNPFDVLVLQFVSVHFQGFECLRIDRPIKIQILSLLSSYEFLLLLLFFVKTFIFVQNINFTFSSSLVEFCT